MIVCLCHKVSDHDIARAVAAGCSSFDDLQLELGVACSCGRCHDDARETFDHLHHGRSGAHRGCGTCGGCDHPRQLAA